MSSTLNWSNDIFIDSYNSIKLQGYVSDELLSVIAPDLIHILTAPGRDDAVKNTILDRKTPVQFSNGDRYTFNEQFIEACFSLAVDLDLNELAAAEILQYSRKLRYETGTTFIDGGRFSFFIRYQYILNILGFLIQKKQLNRVLKTPQDFDTFKSNLLKSFDRIYKILAGLNDLIDKQKLTNNINDVNFVDSITYIRSELFRSHEFLSKIYFSMIESYFNQFGSIDFYEQVVNHITQNITEDDLLIVHFLPGLFAFINNLDKLSETDVYALHKKVTSKIQQDYANIKVSDDSIDLSTSKLKGFEVLLNVMILTNFTAWCKAAPSRSQKIDFKDDILHYIEIALSYGVMEKLLCLTAETTNAHTREALELNNLCDFRALLQRTYPKLAPVKFIHPNAQDFLHLASQKQGYENATRLFTTTGIQVSASFIEELIPPFFHKFFSSFIRNVAIVLSALRDNEEDFLLSSTNRKQIDIGSGRSSVDSDFDAKRRSNDKELTKRTDKVNEVDLEDIASRADLERFYLSFVYTYNYRKELCASFWESDDASNDILGFIMWGLSNNTSPLITATFCLLLGSLASSGDHSARTIWETLVNNNNATLKKNDYSKISIDSILDSLNYYLNALNENLEQDLNNQVKQRQKRQELLFSTSLTSATNDSQSDVIVIELAEDSIAFIAGFILLISSVATNLSSTDERSKEIKTNLFKRFQPIILGLLKFDNSIISLQSSYNSKSSDLPYITINEENRVVLVNLTLTLLNAFAINDSELVLRYQIWDILDRWMYQSIVISSDEPTSNAGLSIFNTVDASRSKPISPKSNVSIKNAFTINLTNLTIVQNLVHLLRSLLKPLSNEHEAFSPYRLLYPSDLGNNYRLNNQIGVWPYIEYLLLDVFARSSDIPNIEARTFLQTTVIHIILDSLNEIDWNFLSELSPKLFKDSLNLDNIIYTPGGTTPLNFERFVKLHHSLAALNFMFDEKAYNTLFKIVETTVDVIEEHPAIAHLVEASMQVTSKILDLNVVFVSRLLPVIKNNGEASNSDMKGVQGFGTSLSLALSQPKTVYDSIYHPKSLGTNGIRDFFEIMLFHIPVITSFGLLVGSEYAQLSKTAIDILQKLNQSPLFAARSHTSDDNLITKNRLLTIFSSSEYSKKIEFSFINQLSDENSESDIKDAILNFMNDDLEKSSDEPCVTHFLLGYELRGNQLVLQDSNTNNLLKTVTDLLFNNLELISSIDYNNGNVSIVDLEPAKLVAAIMDVIVKLCKSPLSASITLKWLREEDRNLFGKLINCQPKIDLDTIWFNSKFSSNLMEGPENSFIENNDSLMSFFSFLKQRTLALQYLTLELHGISQQRSIYKRKNYIDLLLNGKEFLDGSHKVLNFLDVLNLRFTNFELYRFQNFVHKYDLPVILNEMKHSTKLIDMNVLNKVFKLLCQTSAAKLITKEAKQSFANEITEEGSKVSEFLKKYIITSELKTCQLSCLHAWVQLIEMIINDAELTKSQNRDLILEVLSVVLPKTNDYFETDATFSEEFISLCVVLFDYFEQDYLLKKTDNKDSSYFERLVPLFTTCVSGIMSPNSTPELRSDLYVLSSRFLQRSFQNQALLDRLLNITNAIDPRFVEILCNDSILCEGAPRITALLLLEALLHLSSLSNSSFILDLMTKNNSLLVIIRSIKRTDEMFTACSTEKSGVRLDSLLYELTTFKATFNLLIRLAQTREGASYLIQSELFAIIKQSKFLLVDPDLGLSLNIDDSGDITNAYIKLSLDNSLKMSSSSGGISYFEFLVPVFQLISAILLSMGPSYKPSKIQANDLLKHFNKLYVGVIKRDVLLDSHELDEKIYSENSIELMGLNELIKQFILIDSLVSNEN